MDAGDFVKFNLPMSSSVTMLGLGGYYFMDEYKKAKLY